MVWNSLSAGPVLFMVIAVAGLARLPVLCAPPYLSSDIYRYIWDGRVEAAGINPYRYIPADPHLEALRDLRIYPQINRNNYAPTIYPPVAEAIFLGVTRVSESVTAMKAAMVGFEVVTVVVLFRLLAGAALPSARILVYAWHPLPIWEFAGSGHIDAAMIALIALAFWAQRKGWDWLAGLEHGWRDGDQALSGGAGAGDLSPLELAHAGRFRRNGAARLPALCRRRVGGFRLSPRLRRAKRGSTRAARASTCGTCCGS